MLILCVCACAWRQPNKSLYLLPWLFFLITAFFIFMQSSIFPAEAPHACTHRKKSPQCTLICLLLQIERRHLLINLQSATVDPLPVCSVKTCNCDIYPVQVSLALPPPAPQGQSPAPCLHCWQVSKLLAVGCGCARHRDWGKSRNDCLQPSKHKQFKLKKPFLCRMKT